MRLVSGLDLVEVRRLRELDQAIYLRFSRRVLTPAELRLGSDAQFLAGRFAAKEAAAKALGCGIGEIRWQDMEILNDERGAPVIRLTGAAARRSGSLGITHWSVSITHTAGLAAAQVIGLGEG
jgi:holo-[acyl-carrier protein] synthase